MRRPERRRAMRRRSGALALALLLLLPARALAEDPPRTDPEVGTPSESVYAIPFEEARRDAAPGVMPGSAIRTENSVGSSARVPGRGRTRVEGGPPVERERRVDRRRERHREAAQAAARLSGEPSPVATGVLIALLVGIAGAGGVATGRLMGARRRL